MGSLPLPLLLTFVLDCHQMKAVMTLLKCTTTCRRVCNYRNYYLFQNFQGGFRVADFFNDTLIFFVYVDKTFLWAMRKIVSVTLWLDVLFVVSGFIKNEWASATKSFLPKINIKHWNVVTANCNVYNETLHLWNFFVLLELLITEAHEYENRRQKVFAKVVISKIVIKNSYVLATSQNDNQDKVKPFENWLHFFVKFTVREKTFRRKGFQRILLLRCQFHPVYPWVHQQGWKIWIRK